MSSKTRAILIGMLGGALLGVAFAWIASDGGKHAQEDEHPLKALGPADYFQLGIGILTLARQFGAMIKGV